MNHHAVVIVGAGPTGLMTAGELALAGVPSVVLDRLPGPSAEPKANGLVGQVVRALDMRGLHQRLSGEDAAPQPVPQYIFSGIPVPLHGVTDNPLYGMRIPQPRLVRHLVDWVEDLGVPIRWGHEVLAVEQDDRTVRLTVRDGDELHDLSADYLVAADGGRSPIRKGLGIGFPGSTSDMVGRIAHVDIPHRYRAPDGGLVVPGFGRVRFGHNRFERGGVIFAEMEPGRPMLGTLEFGPPDPSDALTMDEMRDSVRRLLGTDLDVRAPTGPGPHALRKINGQNTRLAEQYRVGNVFLVGDAAHVHSAMGGPGLNLGLQDALNLGWKLAAAVRGRAPAGLLDTYFTERHPVGERVMLQSMAQTALMRPGPEITALRSVLGEMVQTPDGAGYLAHLMAGADVRYDTGDDHRLSGRMVPDWTLGDGRRIAELLHGARPVLLDTSGRDVGAAVSPWADRIDVVTAPCDAAPDAVLIRPDGYVAWASDDTRSAAEHLVEVARRWFGARGPSR